MATYPSLSELLEQNSDVPLLECKRCLESILPRVALFLLVTTAIIFVNYKAANSNPYLLDYLRWLGLVPVVVVLDILRVLYDDLYVLSDKQVERFKGRLSFNSAKTSINYGDIRGVVVEQSFFGRMFDYGDILLGTAAQEDNELIIEGVKSPDVLRILIQGLRDEHAKQSQDKREFDD